MSFQQEQRVKIHSLTSIRLFCTLQVVVHHLNLVHYTSDPLISFIDRYILHTGRGVVSFFFFLSGFVICYSSRHWSGWKSYLIRRSSRVFPNHWIISLTIAGFTFVVPLLQGEDLFHYIRKVILNLALLQSYVPDIGVNFSFNGVAWTLSLELSFYLFFLLIRRLTTGRIFFLFLVLYGTKLLLETIWVLFNIKYLAHWLFFICPIFRLPEFLLGVLMCRVYCKDSQVFIWFRVDPIAIIILTILTIGVCRYYFPSDAIYLYSTVPSFFGFLLLLSCLGKENNKSNYLSNKILLFLGDASFSIYLIHQPIFNGARRLSQKFGVTMSVSLMLAVALFSLVVAVGYFFFIERKVYERSVKFLDKLF